MRWIFENWRLDVIGDYEKLFVREFVFGGNVQVIFRKFEEGFFVNSIDQELVGFRLFGGDVRVVRWLFEIKLLDELIGQIGVSEVIVREFVVSGDVRGIRMFFEIWSLDRLGFRFFIQEQSFLELRLEIQELKGDVKKIVKLF